MIKRLVLELDEETHQKIKERALKENKSMREILLDLVTKWLKKQ